MVITPLQKLDDAVQEFMATTELGGNGAFVTGWTLGIATARVQSDDESSLPMVSGMQYTLGPQTSIVQMAGLAKFLDVVAERAMYDALNSDDDSD